MEEGRREATSQATRFCERVVGGSKRYRSVYARRGDVCASEMEVKTKHGISRDNLREGEVYYLPLLFSCSSGSPYCSNRFLTQTTPEVSTHRHDLSPMAANWRDHDTIVMGSWDEQFVGYSAEPELEVPPPPPGGRAVG